MDLENFKKTFESSFELSFRFALENDLDTMSNESYGYDQKNLKKFKGRLKEGDKCLLSVYKDTIIGYIWIMKGQMELTFSRNIFLPEHRIYIYNGLVLKQFRGKKVLNAMDCFLIDQFKSEHKKILVTTVEAGNESSIIARKRIGFKEVGSIIIFSFVGFDYGYISKQNLLYLQT